MFILQKNLSVLNVPRERVAMLYRSDADIQLALPDLPSQLATAFLVVLKGGGKGQVLIGLYMTKSHQSLLYVSDAGEVDAEHVDQELEAGFEFAESMGFILNDAELDRMTAEQQEVYWKTLPICHKHVPEETSVVPEAASKKKKVPTTTSTDKPAGIVRPVTKPVKKIITQPPPAATQAATRVVRSVPIKTDRRTKSRLLKEHLGRFLASL